MLIVHEVMGRNCGWLTAYTARDYRKMIKEWDFFIPELDVNADVWDIDAVWIPEMEIDFEAECARLRERMDRDDCVQVFLSEGAGVETIVKEMEAAGEEVARDAFGHVRLDEINPGAWFAKQLKDKLGAEKVLVQKSGYFARSAAPNEQDLELIKRCCTHATRIDFPRINKPAGSGNTAEGRDARCRPTPAQFGARYAYPAVNVTSRSPRSTPP
jgi:pyrophosphate--fructose-6-phosphate 1-phosphotransferase